MNNKNIAAFLSALKSFVSISHGDTIYLHGCKIHDLVILTGNEHLIIKNSVASRQYEFSAGRYCARQCLSHYGVHVNDILKRPLGDPLWPKDYTGTLSHHDNIALAAVTPTTGFSAIGIDLTSSSEKLEGSSSIMNDDEKALINETFPEGNTELLIFCIKEAAIKICSPLLEDYIEFTDLKLQKDSRDNLFISHPSIKQNIDIIWHASHGMLFSLAVLR